MGIESRAIGVRGHHVHSRSPLKGQLRDYRLAAATFPKVRAKPQPCFTSAQVDQLIEAAYRKALAWLGHSSSEMLDLYYHLHDEDSRQAMIALAEPEERSPTQESPDSPSEGSLRAMEQTTIEKTPQAPELQELVACLTGATERAGFEPARQVLPRLTV